MMFDIDHFKQVNDSYGHASGDEVLKDIAVRVSDNVRDFDLVSRYGGEEFVIIMPNTAAEAAYMVAERVRSRIADMPFAIPGREQPLSVTISIGVATTSDPAEQATAFLGRADALLYEAKGAGRNCTRSDEIVAAPQAGQAVVAGA
jgi:two-component system cell cycle response regulator